MDTIRAEVLAVIVALVDGEPCVLVLDGPLEHAAAVLAAHGYEPSITGDTAVLRNCPFHSLAQAHTDLVCTMNLHLIEGLVESLGDGVVARLDPHPPYCCVTLGRR